MGTLDTKTSCSVTCLQLVPNVTALGSAAQFHPTQSDCTGESTTAKETWIDCIVGTSDGQVTFFWQSNIIAHYALSGPVTSMLGSHVWSQEIAQVALLQWMNTKSYGNLMCILPYLKNRWYARPNTIFLLCHDLLNLTGFNHSGITQLYIGRVLIGVTGQGTPLFNITLPEAICAIDHGRFLQKSSIPSTATGSSPANRVEDTVVIGCCDGFMYAVDYGSSSLVIRLPFTVNEPVSAMCCYRWNYVAL
ncbi:hypothetical protein Pelo_18078 [Pelomyxa schiedti]|nr:hypothetical protein Pelo_18078 [Pelomyxa schiedti]